MTKANDEFKKYIYQNSPFKAIYSKHAQYGKFKITKFLSAIIREEFWNDGWKANISYHSLNNLFDELREQFPQDMSPSVRFWYSPINYACFILTWDWWFGQQWNMIFSSRYHFITIWIHQRFTKPEMNFCKELALFIIFPAHVYIFILILNNIITSS